MKLSEIGVCFAHSERKRMEFFLEKFLRHIKQNKLVICGGLATRYHLITHDTPFPQRSFNDLDLLIESIDDIKSSVISDFMLYHYHPPRRDDPVEKTYFFYAFVDPISHIKADIFPYRWSAPERFVKAEFQDKPIRVVGIEDQLIQCLYDVSRISEKQKVDPKQLHDVHSLLQISDVKLAKHIWKTNNHPLYPKTINEAIKQADLIFVKYKEWWQEKPYQKPKPYTCLHCQNRPDYPITDMRKIYKVLKYVE